MSFCLVAKFDDLWSGEMLGLEVEARPVLLVNLGGRVSAYEDRCCHKGVRLSQGRLEGSRLTCFAHGWQYDVSTGEGINPESVRLRGYPVKIENGDIYVDVRGSMSDGR